ncbi:Zn-dependent oxidoreductase, NADPH:quinone reductase [Schinkia azotoformans MEV2011]|uniref:Zn-dependent oxidoreductase, NADPH:quinone reductase n=1 Tax=Schinkia azotoformans MEV2011 TaxID=1348973 RepID=A0A072NPE1_SCHAZ|nr:zinc-dependent alcohol dehydrogenase family protein [Schinkia azotoformans]KEF39351.1 Zn-dependent oxidoreductase, NADPH:quinone reductase [Schinkia azotoformans MEV2011]MEC1694897.1 zinc-dependent alcohol dehydrogenase family protein [Schinkia azotoformans]MEC1725508.1 zinc-dependent alcohol dehydrogenase family protein [Schinkia azotoformans]MEC1770675.1 zinc-dependent alcohol dehydrogenase family protein [Schinkia azotoformans]MEC1778152.1 zinc-dependent alcohol dehydrogenase family prot
MEATCIKFYEFGSPESVLKVERKNIQPPTNGEVLVRMKVRPINPSDLIPIRGAYSHRVSLPNIPGYEGIGIVEDVGASVSQELIGKRVLPLRGEGTWQEFVKTSAEFAVPIPNSIDDYTASQLYINPVTAWIICTEVLKLAPNDVLLVNACGSAIGRIFAQLSKVLGFRLIAVTRNNNYTKDLLQLGASHVVNTSETALHDTVMELTNGLGAASAIDSIGGADGTELAFCVRPNGIFLTLGLLSGTPVDWQRISLQAKVNTKLFHLRYWNQQVSVQTWQETFHRLITLINDEKLTLMQKDSQYDLLQVKEAVLFAESSKRNKGKIFLTS